MEDNEIRREIVLRHLDREIFQERKNEKILEKISHDENIMSYIIKTPKENGQLSSWDYKNFGFYLSLVELIFKINRKVEMGKFVGVPEWNAVQFKK